MKKLYLIGVLVMLLSIVGCSKQSFIEPTELTYYKYFDTIISIAIYEDVDSSLEATIAKRLSEIHDKTNNFASSSNYESIFDLNNNQVIGYDEELAYILETSIAYYNNYERMFNVALGPVIEIWKDALENCNSNNVCEVPKQEQLVAASSQIDANKITITKEQISIEPGMNVDLGGVAKGYAADEVSELLQAAGYEYFIINAGGNIVASQKAQNLDFTVGIIDPVDNRKQFVKLKLNNLAVVTSGDYERFYEVDGVRYHHLISPETLYPATMYHSVSVIGKNSMEADILSTLLFNLSYEVGAKYLEELADYEAIWYFSDGSTKQSSGIGAYEI